jgi:hypothetical protein
MYTPGPAMIFFTSACDLPQNEQRVMREDLAMRKEVYGGSGAGKNVIGRTRSVL